MTIRQKRHENGAYVAQSRMRASVVCELHPRQLRGKR